MTALAVQRRGLQACSFAVGFSKIAFGDLAQSQDVAVQMVIDLHTHPPRKKTNPQCTLGKAAN